jgi:sugar phosphate isomerase/epimerase
VLETVKTEHLPFTEAVRRGVFCEPQSGILDFHALAATLKETGFDGYGIVEQDMYPADPKVPLCQGTVEPERWRSRELNAGGHQNWTQVATKTARWLVPISPRVVGPPRLARNAGAQRGLNRMGSLQAA